MNITSGLAEIMEGNQGYGGGLVRMETRGGAVLAEGAWGTLAAGSREPVAASTPFETASITKTFTATAILLLIGNGRLASLSQPLSAAAPRLLLGGAPPHWHNVTLRQLLQHTSGLQDYWQDRAFIRAFEADEQRLWKPAEILGYAARMPPLPHAFYHYSDTNYVLAGRVVEEASGMALADFLREAIFAPLGMNDTNMSFDDLAPFRNPIIAHRYEGHEDLTIKRRQSADWAGGGLVSTTRDLNRFLIQGLVESRIGGPGILEKMQSEPVPTDVAGVAYGLGLFLIDAEDELGPGARVWGHEGWGHSFLWYDEQAQIVVSGTVNQQDERADPYDALMAAMAAGRRSMH